MSDYVDLLLSGILVYGPAILGISVFIGAAGIPLPVTLLIIAGGAFARQEVIDIYVVGTVGLFGAIGGDCIGFGIGYYSRHWLEKRFQGKAIWFKSKDLFQRQGGLAIFLTRFWLTALATPVNWISGGNYSFWKFLLFDSMGEVLWVVAFSGIGYLAGSQWETFSDIVSNFSGLSIGVLFLAIGIYLVIKMRQKRIEKAAASLPVEHVALKTGSTD